MTGFDTQDSRLTFDERVLKWTTAYKAYMFAMCDVSRHRRQMSQDIVDS